jgi:glycosyltransferase involved in cell wall biosynthesis
MNVPPNIVVLGPWHERSGTGRACAAYLQALLTTDARVAARPLFFSPAAVDQPPDIDRAEARVVEDPDVVLHLGPPYAWEYLSGPRKRATNVGLFFTETYPLPPAWTTHCNLMDAVVCPSAAQADWCRRTPHFRPPLSVVPVPVDLTRFLRTPPRPAFLPPSADFRFYAVGDFVRRKNWDGLLTAYCRAFRRHDPVELVVKTGGQPGEADAFVRAALGRCGPMPHPKVRVVSHRVGDDELDGLHAHADCYVTASLGEGWQLDAQAAVGFGKTPVVPAWGGLLDAVPAEAGWHVPVHETPCYDGGGVHAPLFSADKTWAAPDLAALASTMRAAFEDAPLRATKAAAGLSVIESFSPEAVGRRLLEALCPRTNAPKP